MTENVPTPNEPKKLNDEELSEIVGGYGFWDHHNEMFYEMKWSWEGSPGTFEDWLREKFSTPTGEDYMHARDA